MLASAQVAKGDEKKRGKEAHKPANVAEAAPMEAATTGQKVCEASYTTN